MKLTIFSIALSALVAAVSMGCTKIGSVPEPVVPLYKTLEGYSLMTSTLRDSVLVADSLPLSVMFGYLGISEHPDDSILEKWSESAAVKVFTPVVDSVFENIGELQACIRQILGGAVRDSLDLPRRHYAAVVWGNPRSIVMADSCMLVALNHYLGADFAGYSHLPEYMKASKTPAQLPYDICEALIANRYPFKGAPESTVLSRMLYEGAIIVTKLRLLPDSDAARAMGYTDAELEWLTDHRAEIWKQLVVRNLLYSTSSADAEHLVSPAPYTSILGSGVPPRAGRYIGYTIVRSYIRNNSNVGLPFLLSPSFYNNPSALIEAAYE